MVCSSYTSACYNRPSHVTVHPGGLSVFTFITQMWSVLILPEQNWRKNSSVNYIMRSRAGVWPNLTRMWSEDPHGAATGPDEWPIPLMWNRDGGLGYFKCFKFSKTVTSLQKTAKPCPQSHTHDHREREKWALSARPRGSLFLQHVRQSGKVCGVLCLYLLANVLACFIHFTSCLHVQNEHVMWSCNVSVRSTDCFLVRVYVWVCVKCASSFCFLHFPVLFSPRRCFLHCLPLSVCPLGQHLWTPAMKRPLFGSSGVCWKNPCLNSVDPPAAWGLMVVVELQEHHRKHKNSMLSVSRFRDKSAFNESKHFTGRMNEGKKERKSSYSFRSMTSFCS